LIGPPFDRRDARTMLCSTVLVTGACNRLLRLLLHRPLNFAAPFDIDIYEARMCASRRYALYIRCLGQRSLLRLRSE
jgi:hypothetical protein